MRTVTTGNALDGINTHTPLVPITTLCHLCTQSLHAMHRMEFSATPLLHATHGQTPFFATDVLSALLIILLIFMPLDSIPSYHLLNSTLQIISNKDQVDIYNI